MADSEQVEYAAEYIRDGHYDWEVYARSHTLEGAQEWMAEAMNEGHKEVRVVRRVTTQEIVT